MSALRSRKAASSLSLLGWGLLALTATTRTLAADAQGASETLSLESVVVTAQRREENSQSVPIAISTVSGDELGQRGAVSIQTLSATIPNLTSTGSFNSNMYVRGVGSNSASPNNEPSVATYVDGVYNPSQYGMSSFAFNKIERIEVLRGPQGTLFGRNATAGVVQIITPDPEHDVGGNVGLGYGNYATVEANGYLTGGFTDDLAADLAVLYQDQGEGFGHNLTTGHEIHKHKNIAARSKWLLTPADATKVTAALDYSRYTSDGANNQLLPGSVAIDRVTTYPGEYNAYGDVTVNDNEQYGASVRVDQDIGSLHGVSITAYRNVNGHWLSDNDLTSARLTNVENDNDADYWTQELQLSSRDPGRVEWLAGAFFYANQVDVEPQVSYGTRVTPTQYNAAYGGQKTRSVSGFGQATAEIFTDTKLTLGLRYTDETLKTDSRRVNAAGQVFAGPFKDEISFDPWTWRAALDHQFNPDVLGYVSWNRGFKSGGYNLSAPGTAAFFPESVDAYEVGLKSEMLGHRVRLNVAVFYYDYQNLQVAIVPGGGTQIFTNAAAARNYGLDAGLDFAATDNLTLSMGVGLLDAEYKDYPNAQGFTALGVALPLANAKGQSLPYAPPFSGFLSANYTLPTSVGDFRGTASVSYNDRSYISPTEQPARPAYELVSGSIEWWSQSASAFGVRLWGRNLTNSYYPKNMISSSNGWYQSPADPRTYGLTVMQRF